MLAWFIFTLDVSQMLCVLVGIYVNVFASVLCMHAPVYLSHSFSWKGTSCTRRSLRIFRRCSIKPVWRARCWRGSWKPWRTAWRRRRLSSARCFLPPTWTKRHLLGSQTKLRYCCISPFCLFVFSHLHPCTFNHGCHLHSLKYFVVVKLCILCTFLYCL